MKTRLTLLAAIAALGVMSAPVTATPAAPARAAVSRLIGVGDATQVISVISGGYADTTAAVRAYAKRAGKWHEVFGPWAAYIGYAGFAPPGEKREGDGRTPSGSYGFSFFFGVDRKPSGISYRWRHAATYDFWDDDSASPRYNEWVDARRHDPGRSPEPMHVVPAYEDGAVISYNAQRTPGLGSAIFLHVTHHSATNGCVSLARPDLLALLRWLDPADHPRIIMGTAATVTR